MAEINTEKLGVLEMTRKARFDRICAFVYLEIQNFVDAEVKNETRRCKELICEHCAHNIPVKWWRGTVSFWSHCDSNGVNIGICKAEALQKKA